MTKKILAATLALVMCAGLAACGDKKDDKDTSSKASKSAGTDKQTTADETASDESEPDATTTDAGTAENAGPEVNTDNMYQTADVTMKLINNNIIYIDENNLEDRPTDEEVQKAIDAIFKQYKAAEDKDTQAFLDTMNFGILNEPAAELCDLVFKYDNDHSNEEFQQELVDTKQSTKYAVIDDVIGLLEQLGDTDVNDQLNDAMEAKDGAKIRELMPKLTDSVKPGAEAIKTNLDETSIFNSKEDIQKIGEFGDDATYGFFLEYCGRYEDQLYMRLTFSVLAGDKEYDFGGIETWSVGDEIGVFLTGEAYEVDMEEDMKGMSTKAIFEALKLQMTTESTTTAE